MNRISIPKQEMESTIITRLAEIIANFKYEDLPEEVIEETKRLILDSVGNGISGLFIDKGKFALNICRRLFPGNEATVLGLGEKLSLVGAAAVNGEMMNAMDNGVVVPPGHVAEYMLPVILAYAEKNKKSGKDIIKAVALGYELTHRIASACSYHRDIKGDSLDTPKVFGFAASVFGAVAGLCVLDGLDREKTADAIGITAWSSPINNLQIWGQHVRSAVKYGNASVYAETAITCFEQAKIGYEGDWNAFEDDAYSWGKMIASTRWACENIEVGYGKEWLFPKKQSYKLYPSCRVTAAPIDITLKLFKEEKIDTDHIQSILILSEAVGLTGKQWHNPNPRTQWESESSMQHVIALSALGYKPGPEWMDPSTISDPKVIELRNKVTYKAHPDYIEALKKDPGARPTHLEVVMDDGTVYTADEMYPKGNNKPEEYRITAEELYEKYVTNTQRLLPIAKIDQSMDAILNLEKYDDYSEVATLLGI